MKMDCPGYVLKHLGFSSFNSAINQFWKKMAFIFQMNLHLFFASFRTHNSRKSRRVSLLVARVGQPVPTPQGRKPRGARNRRMTQDFIIQGETQNYEAYTIMILITYTFGKFFEQRHFYRPYNFFQQIFPPLYQYHQYSY